MITEQDKEQLRSSWAQVVPIAGAATDLFYDRLFTLRPDLRGLFPADLSAQKGKLAQALGFVVANLDRPEALVPALEEMGRRHRGYGVQAEHYGVVGEALLWTLAQGLGEGFTEPVREAWTRAYGLVSGTMLGAA